MRLRDLDMVALTAGIDYLTDRDMMPSLGDPRICSESYVYLKLAPPPLLELLRQVPHTFVDFATMGGPGRNRYHRMIFDRATILALFAFAGVELRLYADYRPLSEVAIKYWRRPRPKR